MKIVRVIEQNGSLVYVEYEDGSRAWVDYRDVYGWNC